MKYKTIGILGGIGPAASADMYSRLIKYMQNTYQAWDDADFPQIMVYSTAIKGFDDTGIVDKHSAERELVRAITKLEKMGSQMVVVACNSVHYFDHAMQAALNIPLVHMVDRACEEAFARGYKKVGIFSSQSTRDLKQYSDSLRKLGIEPVIASDDEQAILNQAIKDVMSGRQGAHNVYSLRQILRRYREAGAEATILGCTELPIIMSQSNADMPILDANDIVIKCAVNLARRPGATV